MFVPLPTPLTRATVAVLANWLAERGDDPQGPVLPTRRGSPLSRDAVADLVAKYVERAAKTCPSLAAKEVTPYTLRHTAAMALQMSDVARTASFGMVCNQEPIRVFGFRACGRR